MELLCELKMINNIQIFILLVALLTITFSFAFHRRKVLIILRALFSLRYLQQLFHDGKFSNKKPYFYANLLYITTTPCMVFTFFRYATPQLVEKLVEKNVPYHLSFLLLFLGICIVLIGSKIILKFFTTIFNHQEQEYLYTTTKTLFRFYNAMTIICILPIVWFAGIRAILFFVYIPAFVIIFLSFIIQFLRIVNQSSRIHFFIYFCSVEILPYVLLFKLIINT